MKHIFTGTIADRNHVWNGNALVFVDPIGKYQIQYYAIYLTNSYLIRKEYDLLRDCI